MNGSARPFSHSSDSSTEHMSVKFADLAALLQVASEISCRLFNSAER